MNFLDRPKLVIGGAALIAVLFVVGSYFGSQWYYGEVTPVPEELLTIPPRVYHDSTPIAKSPDMGNFSVEEENIGGSYSPSKGGDIENPSINEEQSPFFARVEYFADGTQVPEHLLIPEKWVNLHVADLKALGPQEVAEYRTHSGRIVEEVLANHNPNRPISEIWDTYIDMEWARKAEDEATGKNWLSGGSLSHQFSKLYRFPEIAQLDMSSGIERHRFHDMYMVEMGAFDADWNLHILPDGREFRTETGYLYEFRLTAISEDETAIGTRTFRVGHSGRDAQLVVIDLSDTSDEELERIGGWNYNNHLYK